MRDPNDVTKLIVVGSMYLLFLGAVFTIIDYSKSESYKSKQHNIKVMSISHDKINRDLTALKYAIHSETK